MNRRMVLFLLGRVMLTEAILMLLPCLVAVIYRESSVVAFFPAIFIALALGVIFSAKRPANHVFYAKEGFITVALSWILISAVGALPFYISGEIPSYTDSLFEMVSGFTTTGASILKNVEALSKCMLFWRSFSHWIGGMGVLVFLLAIVPTSGGYSMNLMKAESPGPSVGKLAPKSSTTAKNLYIMYFGLTVVEIVLLCLGDMRIFDAMLISFGTAGTGGFAILNTSLESYSAYIQVVVTVFMILFGINFTVYFYLFYERNIKKVLKSEELRWYIIIIVTSVILITVNITPMYDSISQAWHQAAFQVGSIITTTGFSTTDFNLWPEFSRVLLIILMFFGACAGSTGGGFKISRVVLLVKTMFREFGHIMHPRSVKAVTLDGKKIEHSVARSLTAFFVAYVLVMGFSVLLISGDGFDFTTNVSAVMATLNNIGPGLEVVGPMGNYSGFSLFAKYVLIFDMLAGRLELFPMLMLFVPKAWKKQ